MTQPPPQSAPASRPIAAAPPPAFAVPAPAAPGADGNTATMSADGVNLQELARTAAMGAEKEAIQHALERFRWNRRKTAEYLQVSYKTLLNKMKECGISESPNA
jgi:two-component system response regulator AtoC